ncbi:MAG: hypothetical protein EHM20_09225 [Alphaproteobacteria bacterium]|nr:MAG: hypothetical protein EHM20_09225 [Alphaproteobacteria bacterium]
MKIKIISLALIFTLQTYASTLPQNKEDYCARFNTTSDNQQTTIQDLSLESTNLMGFKNNGGLFNGGVCWWHSRFQRNIFYLSIFRPDLDKPKSTYEIKNIIHQVRLGTNVVTIPGYGNLEEFSKENQSLIQSELNNWQLYDGVILGSWINGLKGDTRVRPDVLEKMMNELNIYVREKKKVGYQKLQIKGITSHAWLVVGIKKMPSGFEVGYLDSNSPNQSLNYSYKIGDSSFFIKNYGDFVPYLEFKREEERLVDAAKVYCGLKSRNLNSHDLELEYELDLKEAIRMP